MIELFLIFLIFFYVFLRVFFLLNPKSSRNFEDYLFLPPNPFNKKRKSWQHQETYTKKNHYQHKDYSQQRGIKQNWRTLSQFFDSHDCECVFLFETKKKCRKKKRNLFCCLSNIGIVDLTGDIKKKVFHQKILTVVCNSHEKKAINPTCVFLNMWFQVLSRLLIPKFKKFEPKNQVNVVKSILVKTHESRKVKQKCSRRLDKEDFVNVITTHQTSKG